MVGSTFGVYVVGLIFVSARTNKRHHHHLPLAVMLADAGTPAVLAVSPLLATLAALALLLPVSARTCPAPPWCPALR